MNGPLTRDEWVKIPVLSVDRAARDVEVTVTIKVTRDDVEAEVIVTEGPREDEVGVRREKSTLKAIVNQQGAVVSGADICGLSADDEVALPICVEVIEGDSATKKRPNTPVGQRLNRLRFKATLDPSIDEDRAAIIMTEVGFGPPKDDITEPISIQVAG